MSPEKPRRRMIDVDTLQERLTPQQVASFYGTGIEYLGSGQELRGPCPCVDCDGHEDPRSISINTSGVKMWKCHRGNYGCGAQGKLLELAYCLKFGRMPAGKLAGQEFYAIAQDLEQMAGEGSDAVRQAHVEHSPAPNTAAIADQQKKTRHKTEEILELKPNLPLEESDNEKTRELAQLHERFTVKLDDLPPHASKYVRFRPHLRSEELATECQFGYCPSSEKTMVRGKFVYSVQNEQGQPLVLVGRNTSYEFTPDQQVTPSGEDSKYKFPRQEYFRRGLELYGQEFLNNPKFSESLQRYGIILNEGFTDRIRLHQLGVMSLAMMSNQLTEAQVHKLVGYANKYGQGRVGIMHDADEKGDEGAKESLWKLHSAGIDAYLVWNKTMHDGKYIDRQPESLSDEEWQELSVSLEK